MLARIISRVAASNLPAMCTIFSANSPHISKKGGNQPSQTCNGCGRHTRSSVNHTQATCTFKARPSYVKKGLWVNSQSFNIVIQYRDTGKGYNQLQYKRHAVCENGEYKLINIEGGHALPPRVEKPKVSHLPL
jgi:hypothetical protein